MQLADSSMEKQVIRKLSWRLLPILVAGYLIAIIDRANIGIAALTMNADIGLTAATFGLAAGMFFIPYILLELPSNLALEKVGARVVDSPHYVHLGDHLWRAYVRLE
ncbi:sugar phosphate permease [Ewingella americana]